MWTIIRKSSHLSILLCCLIIIERQNALIIPSQQRRIISNHYHHHHYKIILNSRSSSLSRLLASTSSEGEEQPQTSVSRTPRRVKIRARTSNNKGSSPKSMSSTLLSPRGTKKRKSSSITTKKKSTNVKNTNLNNRNIPSSQQQQSNKKFNVELEETQTHEEKKYYKPTSHTKSGRPFQHQEMLDHTILTKEEELMYGRQIVRMRFIKENINVLLEERRTKLELQRLENMNDEEFDGLLGEGEGEKLDYDFLTYELEYLSMYGFRCPDSSRELYTMGEKGSNRNSNNNNGNSLGGFDLEDDLLINHAQHRAQHMSQLQQTSDTNNKNYFVPSNDNGSFGPKRTGYRNSSSSTSSPANRNSYTSILQMPIHELTENDVINTLKISGGKSELVDILLDGAYAREVLMRRNVKLVMSIAKNWMRNSFSTANANLSGSGAGSGGGAGSGSGSYGGRGGSKGNVDKSTNNYLAQMYEGSWDRPSLDEAVQEGMLGLARAVDKYDPERGLRFSTYATHWITSYVRVCFQRAVTGCLRVPSQLHDIKAAYNKIIKDHLVVGDTPPDQTIVAEQLGISEKRLQTAIRATGTLVSVDAPIGGGSYKGSMAGGDGSNSQELLILDTLKCAEPKPEDQVEISFLRQCLENAMATELTPYERDVLRLRLGLDSGEGKTVREIAEISGGSVTMSEVRSAERRAFKKLRSPTSVHTQVLLSYLDLAGVDKGTSNTFWQR